MKSAEAQHLMLRISSSSDVHLKAMKANDYWEEEPNAFGFEDDRFSVYVSLDVTKVDPDDPEMIFYLEVENRLMEKETPEGFQPGPTVCRGFFVGEEVLYETLVQALKALWKASPTTYEV